MVKLIAIDMDGTLLTPNHTISERNIAAIQGAQEEGIEVVIATGRAYNDAREIVESTGLELPFICLNGALIINDTKEVLNSLSIAPNLIKDIASELDSEMLHYNVYTDKTVYTTSVEDEIEQYQLFIEAMGGDINAEERVRTRVEKGYLVEVHDFTEVYQREDEVVLKYLAKSSNRANLQRSQTYFNAMEGLYATSSGPGNIEVTAKGAQKGKALEVLCKRMGITMNDCMAIGDNYNDLSMLKRAGTSVVMGNAAIDIKSYADIVVGSNVEDGVAEAIEGILNRN